MKIIYKILLVFILMVFVVVPLVKLPISSSSRGIVRPLKENTKLQAIVNGRVIKTSLLKNNQLIKQGDTLIVVTAEQLDTQKQLQNNNKEDYTAQLKDLDKLLHGKSGNLETGQYQRELSAMNEKIGQVQAQFSLAKNDLDRATILFKKGVISRADYDKDYYAYRNLASQISEIREQQFAQWQTQKREAERQLRSLGSEIQKIGQEENNYIIIAPISGRLFNFSGIQKGNFLIQGQTIAEISPEQSLIAECLVSPKDIGFIHIGQLVKFQIDAYNYNQWGLIDGEVIDIDQNINVNQQTGESYLRVLCKMNSNYLQLKNGYKGNIGKGMTFTARFHLTDRTLWQLLFDKVDDWFNPRIK
ncbi:HlyD family efflux transporter periplasmic adaptor subunit [Chryseobacterium nematophagum]|uniref:HlyD family efflux transporter periplasmic adaptor subunit n=1 Tax=Chryseobacterium nematophagum TaxID=2305228 RepID=A0A3M7TIK1_9FLAO|nr:HlyD family efflux transporter periplasmic adaptor subunit [Chryseobacterium nematophagum]RNA62836.1 HlyD family efflux transporter periplasmic adaptor subunit [Chryseobacterium nematophagum]